MTLTLSGSSFYLAPSWRCSVHGLSGKQKIKQPRCAVRCGRITLHSRRMRLTWTSICTFCLTIPLLPFSFDGPTSMYRMAYIEENMKLRRGLAQQSADSSAGGSTSTTAQPGGNVQAQDDIFSNLDPRYKVQRKPGEEGNVTNSLSMLTAIPEVDLGMEYVTLHLQSVLPLTHGGFFFHPIIISTRLRNIEETEKAKLNLSQGRSRDRKHTTDEAHLAATRCTFICHPLL